MSTTTVADPHPEEATLISSRPAVRTLPDVDLDLAVEALRRYGFHDHEDNEDRTVMKKPGLRFAFKAHQRPMEAVLVPGHHELRLVLRYDVFVAFDTGDLEAHADRLSKAIT